MKRILSALLAITMAVTVSEPAEIFAAGADSAKINAAAVPGYVNTDESSPAHTRQFTVTPAPAGTDVSWRVTDAATGSDTDKATISTDGKLTGAEAGWVTVEAVSPDDQKKVYDSYTIFVLDENKQYYVLDKKAGRALSNSGGGVVSNKAAAGDASQLWTVTETDGGELTLSNDGKFISASAATMLTMATDGTADAAKFTALGNIPFTHGDHGGSGTNPTYESGLIKFQSAAHTSNVVSAPDNTDFGGAAAMSAKTTENQWYVRGSYQEFNIVPSDEFTVINPAAENLVSIKPTTFSGPGVDAIGTVIHDLGGSYQNSYPPDNVFDDNNSTLYDGTKKQGYVGLQLAQPRTVTAARVFARSTYNIRVWKAEIQASNDNTDWTTLHRFNVAPSDQAWMDVRINNTTPYTYYRYYSPALGSTNLASLEFYYQAQKATVATVTSPDNSLKLNLYNGGSLGLSYDVVKGDETVVQKSALGLKTTDAGDFTSNLTYDSGKTVTENNQTETFTMVSGKQLEISETYNKSTFYFKNSSGKEIGIEARMFDEGAAFRYMIDGTAGTSSQVEKDNELTQFVFDGGSEVWYQDYNSDHDNPYKKGTAAAVSGSVNMNVLVKPYANKDLYALTFQVITDASYGGIALQGNGSGGFSTKFSGAQGTKPIDITLPFASPWRVIAVGTAADIAETNLPEVLAPETEMANTSWIEPGVSAWTWYNRDATDDLERFKQYVDLAAELGWKYVLIDEGWQNREGGRSYSGGYGYYGIAQWSKDLVDYAKEKDVGVLVWFHAVDLLNKNVKSGTGDLDTNPANEGTLRTQEEITANLKLYKDAGFAGIKPDFFAKDNQDTRKRVEMLTKACAENELLINYHGLELWPGVRRTQPHIVSIEGVFGEEQNLWDANNGVYELPTQWTMLPFIRNSIGSVDYTPAYSFLAHNGMNANARTLAASTALSVIFEDGVQSLADTVEHYNDAAAKNFFKNLPTVWDETKLLGGAPSDSVIMGRRSGDTWYVGAITEEAKEFTLDLDFLGGGTYYANIYSDGDDPGKYGMTESGMSGQYDNRNGIVWTDVDFEEREVTSEGTITLDMHNKGGAAIRFSKTPSTTWTANNAKIAPNPLETEVNGTAKAALTISEPVDLEFAEWSVEDEDIATVTQDGTVTGVATGTTTLTAANPKSTGVQVTADVIVHEALELKAPWRVTTPLADKVTYGGGSNVQIYTADGDWWGLAGTPTKAIRNLHLAEVTTQTNMEISTELTFSPAAKYHAAGIVFHLNDGNMVTVMRRYHDSYGGNVFMMLHNEGGTPKEGGQIADTTPGAKCEIKLTKTGNVYSAAFRYEGDDDWTPIGITYPNSNVGGGEKINVGLFAAYGVSSTKDSIPATFDNFKLDGTIMPFMDYKVSFETNGGSAIHYLIADADGTETVTKPKDPVKKAGEGEEPITFMGWYTDPQFTQTFDFNTLITKNITLYAKWSEEVAATGAKINAAPVPGYVNTDSSSPAHSYKFTAAAIPPSGVVEWQVKDAATGEDTTKAEIGADGILTGAEAGWVTVDAISTEDGTVFDSYTIFVLDESKDYYLLDKKAGRALSMSGSGVVSNKAAAGDTAQQWTVKETDDGKQLTLSNGGKFITTSTADALALAADGTANAARFTAIGNIAFTAKEYGGTAAAPFYESGVIKFQSAAYTGSVIRTPDNTAFGGAASMNAITSEGSYNVSGDYQEFNIVPAEDFTVIDPAAESLVSLKLTSFAGGGEVDAIGTIISDRTGGSQPPENVFKDDDTYYEGASQGYVGLKLPDDQARTVIAARVFARPTFNIRAYKAEIQASNSGEDEDWTTLHRFNIAPNEAAWTDVRIDNTTSYTYYRYVSPANGYSNLTRLEFYYQKPGLNVTATPKDDGLSINLKNNTAETLTFSVIVALYDADGKLTESKTEQYGNFAAGAEGSFNLSANTALSGETYKVFVWDVNKVPMAEALGGAIK